MAIYSEFSNKTVIFHSYVKLIEGNAWVWSMTFLDPCLNRICLWHWDPGTIWNLSQVSFPRCLSLWTCQEVGKTQWEGGLAHRIKSSQEDRPLDTFGQYHLVIWQFAMENGGKCSIFSVFMMIYWSTYDQGWFSIAPFNYLPEGSRR